MYIGEPFSWKPVAFQGSNGIMSVTTKETTAHGRVVYINEAHRYFTAGRISTEISSERALNFNKNQEEFHHEQQSGLYRSL